MDLNLELQYEVGKTTRPSSLALLRSICLPATTSYKPRRQFVNAAEVAGVTTLLTHETSYLLRGKMGEA